MNKPTKYQIIIRDCGTDTCNFSYKKLENKNPIRLGLSVINILSKDFAGEENANKYLYWLACAILSCFDNINKDNLFIDINGVENAIEKVNIGNENER